MKYSAWRVNHPPRETTVSYVRLSFLHRFGTQHYLSRTVRSGTEIHPLASFGELLEIHRLCMCVFLAVTLSMQPAPPALVSAVPEHVQCVGEGQLSLIDCPLVKTTVLRVQVDARAETVKEQKVKPSEKCFWTFVNLVACTFR